MSGFQDRAKDPRGHIDDGNHSFVGHAARANDAEDAKNLVLGGVRGTHHTQLIKQLQTGILAYKDLRALSMQAAI